FILQKDDFNHELDIKTHPRYTYDSLTRTFSCIQLLIQTLSNTRKDTFKFIPVVQNTYVQHKLKQLYNHIKLSQLEASFISEIYSLFDAIELRNNKNVLHYYIQG
ncbi:hypothetical protein LCC45_17225, partial [Staphylococcus aureus]|nr:hypothetical protein [Staphylococcus aureus]